jgi:uncharacterized membrane protein YhaH (DUF805 family)
LSKAVEPHLKQEDEGKFRCKTCQKLFKATSFVEKHIANKHPELVKQLDEVSPLQRDIGFRYVDPSNKLIRFHTSIILLLILIVFNRLLTLPPRRAIAVRRLHLKPMVSRRRHSTEEAIIVDITAARMCLVAMFPILRRITTATGSMDSQVVHTLLEATAVMMAEAGD